MEKLWAPWRGEFVSGLSNENGCFLCSIGAKPCKDAENFVIARRDNVYALLNRFPYNTGHLLVATYRHVGEFSELTDAELIEMLRFCDSLTTLLKREMKAQGFNVGLNLGRAAGAGVEGHIHLHIVPRWNGDTNFMPVLADVKVLPHDLPTIHAMLTQTPI